eukprot:s2397_g24.t1
MCISNAKGAANAEAVGLNRFEKELPLTTPSTFDSDGVTPLHIAAENGHTEVLQCLLKGRASPHSVTEKGQSPLLMAAEQGHHDAVAVLLTADDILGDQRIAALQVAVDKGFLDVVRCLLKARIDVNATKENGMSPLFISASKGHLAIVQALLDQRASPNLAERHGATPLCPQISLGQGTG